MSQASSREDRARGRLRAWNGKGKGILYRGWQRERLLAAAGSFVALVASRHCAEVHAHLDLLWQALAAAVQLVVVDHQRAGEERDHQDVVEENTEGSVNSEAGNRHDGRDSSCHEGHAGRS